MLLNQHTLKIILYKILYFELFRKITNSSVIYKNQLHTIYTHTYKLKLILQLRFNLISKWLFKGMCTLSNLENYVSNT